MIIEDQIAKHLLGTHTENITELVQLGGNSAGVCDRMKEEKEAEESSHMPNPQAKELQVSPLQRELLQKIVHRTTAAQRLVKRGQIILEAASGVGTSTIAQHLQVDYETVRRWRDRWHAIQERLETIEATGKTKVLKKLS
jgi:Flp pilus assembly CpaE family ATPase